MNMARYGERYLAELLQDFEVDSAVEIGFEPNDRSTKIKVYSMRDLSRGQTAFAYGFFHAGFDSSPYLEWGIHNSRFFNSIKHEMVHVVNLLMMGKERVTCPYPHEQTAYIILIGEAFLSSRTITCLCRPSWIVMRFHSKNNFSFHINGYK